MFLSGVAIDGEKSKAESGALPVWALKKGVLVLADEFLDNVPT